MAAFLFILSPACLEANYTCLNFSQFKTYIGNSRIPLPTSTMEYELFVNGTLDQLAPPKWRWRLYCLLAVIIAILAAVIVGLVYHALTKPGSTEPSVDEGSVDWDYNEMQWPD